MDVGLREEVFVDGVVFRSAPNPTERRLSRFLHDIAQLPGEHEALIAGHPSSLEEQDVAARRRPGETCRHTGLFQPLRYLDEVLGLAQIDAYALSRYVHRVLRLGPLGDAGRNLAADRPDFPLEVAHAGLSRVVPHDAPEGVVIEN